MKLMSDSPALRVCRDLCNGSKHLLIRPARRASVDADASIVREYMPGPVGDPKAANYRIVVLADGKHDLWKLIEDCMSGWEAFAASRV